jgi:plastocyanin
MMFMRRPSKLVLLLGLATAAVLAGFTLRYVLRPSVRLQGRVTFKGAPPRPGSFSLPNDLQRTRLLDDESFLLTQDGSLANVLVYIKDGIHWKSDLHSKQVRVERENCLFKPRVFGVRVGQSIEFGNRDPWVHNVRCHARENPPFNLATVANATILTKLFTSEEVPMAMWCDIHKWERAFAGAFDHPYFAVTGPDGTFSFPEKLKPGVYTLVAWHEYLGIREQRVLCLWRKQTILLTLERRTGS